MIRLNDFIYDATRYAPEIHFGETRTGKPSYKFGCKWNTGTGENFKNLIIYDLSILNNTDLPYLMHADNPKLPDMLRKKSERGKTMISKKQSPSAQKMKSAKDILREYFDIMDVPDDEEGLVQLIISKFNDQKTHYEELNQRYAGHKYPDHELTPDIDEKDVTVKRADVKRDVRDFISYAVGCMFGRYSLDKDGIIYAGGVWNNSKYKTFYADEDGIIPICDDEYFDDDITGRFIRFVETIYGKDTLEENLRFIAGALGSGSSSRDIIRSYFLNSFYSDHCSTYSVANAGKRPIYWLFDSGKKNGFKCLIYMHRYQPDTIARIRTDYVHE